MKKILPIVIIMLLNSIELVSAIAININENKYDLIIIAPSYFSKDLLPLIVHKEQYGIKTKIITLDDIYQNVYFPVSGRDDAEKIKYFIKNALDNWNITYVLIAGGRKHGIQPRWHVPVRYVENNAWIQNYRYISDLYFADIYDKNNIFQSWDTNNDNIFGTINKDNMDFNPDVFIGRWACRNRLELKTIVKKTIQYESQPEKTKKIILIGGDTFQDSTEYDEGEIITNESAKYLQNYRAERIFSSERAVSPQNIREVLGKGASFIHFSGHAWVSYWNTYKHDKIDEISEPGLGIWDIPFFKNTQYPIIVMGGCDSAQIDTSFIKIKHFYDFNIYEYDLPRTLRIIPPIESISWFFNRKIAGGSVASLGYTCSPSGAAGEHGDKDHDDILEPDCIERGYGFIEINFFNAYGQQNLVYLGECWGYAQNIFINTLDLSSNFDFLTVQSFILLGDPSLKIGGYN